MCTSTVRTRPRQDSAGRLRHNRGMIRLLRNRLLRDRLLRIGPLQDGVRQSNVLQSNVLQSNVRQSSVLRSGLPCFLAACLLAACDRARPPAEAPLPAIAQEDGRVEWRGLLPCADCDGIETLLVLERRGEARQYDLTETFLSAHDGARFAESGQWRMQGAALSLEGEGGVSRHYALLPDGRLQPQDGRGRPFRLRGDVLLPVETYAP